MKTGIAGAGSLGSLFASFFLTSGIEIMLYEKSSETVRCIRDGLKIITPGGTQVLHPHISDDPSILADADIIFLFMKSYSTAEAVETISGISKPGSIIVSLQNGLGNFESISKSIDAARIVYGTTTFGAAKASPSEVIFGGRGTISIGGADASAVQKTRELLNSAGCDVYVTDDPMRAVWMKALINAGINPVATILGIKNGEIPDNTFAMQIQELILKEAVEAAASKGIVFSYDSILADTRTICSRTAANTCSMLQDIRAGRKTEIDSINMKITEIGEAAGIAMTGNRIVSLIIKAMETTSSMG